ncbi:MAG TPA: energy-coupled thiamine transporter ThiT [Symbiobacteriaceae bacterium]|jgi:thiamine transporter
MNQNRSVLPTLVETAIMVALAAVLSFIIILKMPQGGEISAGSMIPIILLALRRGPVWGIIGGVLLSFVRIAIVPSGFYTPVQFLIDYPIAFGLLGLAGLVKAKLDQTAALLGSLALVGRFLAHLVSGVVFFGTYAPAGQNVWVYSAIYNGSYMLPELVVTAVLMVILLPVLKKAIPTTLGTQRHSA